MIKKLLQILIVLFFSNSMFSQQNNDLKTKEKSNPIIYIEGFGGPAVVQNFGIAGGVELNYQSQKSLFSMRYTNAAGYLKREDLIVLPSYSKSEDFKEYAFLYGRRWLYSNHSYSISAGISSNNLEITVRDIENNRYTRTKDFIGVPFEANYKWFYAKKKSKIGYNIMIPSVGVKIFGNVSEYSFGGVGVTVGFGLSKYY